MGGSTSERIEHVVVLMLENRSFDHMLGFMQHPDPEFEGIVGKDAHNFRSDCTTRVDATNTGVPYGLDPDHSHEAAREQQGRHAGVEVNGGFVINYEKRLLELEDHPGASGDDVMRCLDPNEHCPALARLAEEFAVCDCWFSSVPGETWPNRNFAHAATSDSTVNIEFGFYYDPTIFELIAKVDRGEERGKSWRIYFDGPPHLWCFRRLWRGRTLLDFLLNREPRIGNWYAAHRFFEHVAAGDLPKYAFIEPAHNRLYEPGRRTNSQHPGNNLSDGEDFQAGEQLIQDVYQALLGQPHLFAKTLFVITYDEQGGLYDHLGAPPSAPPGDPVYRGLSRRIGRAIRALIDRLRRESRIRNFDFSAFGVRVPAVLVSPWIEPNTILRAKPGHPFDHSSIPATLRALFAPNADPLTDRDKIAGTFHEVVKGRRSPRPNSRGPGGTGSDGAMLPDFDSRDERKLVGVSGTDTKADPKFEGELTELDVYLKRHAERVRARLRRRPATLWQRVRHSLARPLRGGRAAREAAARAVREEASPVDVFGGAADAARRSSGRS